MTIDTLFYHNSLNLSEEIAYDLVLGLTQPTRSLFYNRSYGLDFSSLEGAPNTFMLQIVVIYEIMKLFSLRNLRVTDGSAGHPDRRAMTGQDQIAITPNGKDLDVEIVYFEMQNIHAPKSLRWSTGG